MKFTQLQLQELFHFHKHDDSNKNL